MRTDVPGYLYAASMTAGGAYQAIHQKSPRLFAYGAACGVLATYGAYRNSKNNNAVGVMMVTSSSYAAAMTYFYRQCTTFLPFGPSAMISLVMVMRCFIKHTLPNRQQV